MSERLDLKDIPECRDGSTHSWIVTKWVSSTMPNLAASRGGGRTFNQAVEIGCPTCALYLNLAVPQDEKEDKGK